MERINWQQLESEVFDLIIIGGGINGAGIALDAALRGLRVLLVEKKDYGSGTTSASTRLIHGGLRYLEYLEFGLVRESLHEREILLKTAAGMVHPLPILLPIYDFSRRGPLLIRLGMWLYDLLSLDKSLPAHRMLSAAETLTLEPQLRPQQLRGAALYYDSQIEFPERLCWLLIRHARRAGAVALNYCRAVHQETGPTMQRLEVEDLETGGRFRLRARIIINATGPWVDEVRQLRRPRPAKRLQGTKGSHIVVRQWPDGPRHAIYVESPVDGRPIFIIPWLHYYLIGTTDLIYRDRLDEVVISEDEVEYLLRGVNAILNGHQVKKQDILFTYSGVRPLPASRKTNTAAITRRYKILMERPAGSRQATVDIIGGKLTTYRRLAEDTVDKILRLLETGRRRSQTREYTLLPPLNEAPASAEISQPLDASTSRHLLALYGDEAKNLMALVREQPELAHRICPDRPDILAQAVYAVTHEQARHLEDICLRRTSIGWSADMGLSACETIARCIASHLGWSEADIAAEISRYRNLILRKHIPDFLPAHDVLKPQT